jgi:hypothetical protein
MLLGHHPTRVFFSSKFLQFFDKEIGKILGKENLEDIQVILLNFVNFCQIFI